MRWVLMSWMRRRPRIWPKRQRLRTLEDKVTTLGPGAAWNTMGTMNVERNSAGPPSGHQEALRFIAIEDLSAYANRPAAFFARYIRLYAAPHALILSAVALAVLCSVATQYGVKFLVDTLSQPGRAGSV